MKSPGQFWQQCVLSINANINQAICNLNDTHLQIIMVLNEKGTLEGTISDGDIRRGFLKGLDKNSPISSIIHKNVLVVPNTLKRELVMELMITNKIKQIPIVDNRHHVIGLHIWDEIFSPPKRHNSLVIMAGGKGKRLHPYTENCPKSLLQVAGKPMIEHIINHAKKEGFNHFVISIYHLGHMIEEYLGNGQSLGVHINYIREESPLGTAGALSLLSPFPDSSFIVTNCDVMTDISYGDMLDFHSKNGAVATMATRIHELQNPFGVVKTNGIEIAGFEEKPITYSNINAGVYVLDPRALNILIPNKYCDMPTLFQHLKDNSERLIAYPIYESWADLGSPDELALANTGSFYEL